LTPCLPRAAAATPESPARFQLQKANSKPITSDAAERLAKELGEKKREKKKKKSSVRASTASAPR